MHLFRTNSYELHTTSASLSSMKGIIFLLLNFLLITFVSAETVYKTRDAEGNIIFSDVQSEGAEKIEIQDAQTINIPKPKNFDNRPTTKLSPQEKIYTQLKIINPENDATIRSNEGKVDIRIEIEPALDSKHKLVVSMDGSEVASGKSLQVPLSGLDRGTHTITAVVKNEKDKVIKQSNTLVFHLHKQSVLFKNRPDQNTNNTGTVVAPKSDSGAAAATPIIPSL